MTTFGVAIAVPEPYGAQLRAVRLGFGDQAAEHIPTHVTLVPPTRVADSDLDELLPRLDRAARRLSPFGMQLRGTGTFRPVSQVVFVAISQGIAHTQILAREVRSAIGDSLSEPVFPYHPHVTVAHDIDADSLDRAFDELADFECEFDVTEFSLYRHNDTDGWTRHRDYQLGVD